MKSLLFGQVCDGGADVRILSTGDHFALTASSTHGVAAGAPFEPLRSGSLIWVEKSETACTVHAVASAGFGAKTTLLLDALALGLNLDVDPATLAETEALLATGLGDTAALLDLSAHPFVTIDGPSSRDLDQALFLERTPQGYRVHYALADAAFFVKPGTALFAHALARGTSFYLPSLSLPMLPRALSEDLISLGPGVQRRALVVTSELSATGKVSGTTVREALIRSRRKLTFLEVDQFLSRETPAAVAAFTGAEFETSLLLLAEIGGLLEGAAEARGKVGFDRDEADFVWEGDTLVAKGAPRLATERYNEQLSLLCNSEGGRLLFEGAAPWVEPIYRVHPAPSVERLVGFEKLTRALNKRHNNPIFIADSGPEGLAPYMRTLHASAISMPLKKALERQALVLNERSFFSTEPKAHFGVAASPYARLSAPMREIVGIYLHKEFRDLAAGAQTQTVPAGDNTLRELVLEAGNRAKDVQSRIESLVTLAAIQGSLGAAGGAPGEKVQGTIVGFSSAKFYVSLDRLPLDVRVSFYDLAKAWGGGWLTVAEHGMDLVRSDTSAPVLSLGDSIELIVVNLPNGTKGLVPTPRKTAASRV